MYGYRDLGVGKFQILHSELKEPDVERIGKFAIRLIEFKHSAAGSSSYSRSFSYSG